MLLTVTQHFTLPTYLPYPLIVCVCVCVCVHKTLQNLFAFHLSKKCLASVNDY